MNKHSKIALVTGASKGIGRGIAVGLANNGWDVVVNYNRDAEGSEQTAERIRAIGRQAWTVQGDIGFSDQVDRVFDELKSNCHRLDLLVNNAGVQTWSSLIDLEEDDWDRTIRTNLKGCYLCSRRAAEMMKGQGG